MKIFWVVLFSLAAVGGLAYFLFLSSTFQINHIEVLGNQKITTQEIQALIPLKSIFLEQPTAIVKNLQQSFPVIESVTVQKKYPSNIVIYVQERQPFSVFCNTTNKCFSIDKNGVIFEPIDSVAPSSMVITIESDKAVFTGENVVEAKAVDAIAKVRDNLKRNFGVDLRQALVSNPLIFTTSEGWKIYFDPAQDIDLQITKMNALLKDQIPATSRKTLQYMYLQYKDRAYYK